MKISRIVKEGHVLYRCFNRLLYKLGLITGKAYTYNWDNYNLRRLKKRYGHIVNLDMTNKEQTESDYIWVCWLQGMDNAPDVVKKCFERLNYFYSKEKNIVVITADNYSDYVSIPDRIVSLWKKANIGNAHFSDILRTELLIKYGGLWIDSTAFLSDPIPDFIWNSKLFVMQNPVYIYTYPFLDSGDGITGNNWFIYAHSNNPVLINLQKLLYTYLEEHDELKHYYLWHLLFSIVVSKDPEFWGNMPVYLDLYCGLLYRNFDSKFDENKWKELRSHSFVHKLNYKKEFTSGMETFYDKFMEGFL